MSEFRVRVSVRIRVRVRVCLGAVARESPRRVGYLDQRPDPDGK